jgi:hypothetical protein
MAREEEKGGNIGKSVEECELKVECGNKRRGAVEEFKPPTRSERAMLLSRCRKVLGRQTRWRWRGFRESMEEAGEEGALRLRGQASKVEEGLAAPCLPLLGGDGGRRGKNDGQEDH